MSNPAQDSGNSGNNIQNQFNTDLAAYWQDFYQQQTDMAELQQLCAAAGAIKDAGARMQFVISSLLPAMQDCKESGISLLADTDNLASDMRSLVTNIQGIVNKGGSSSATEADAQQLIQDVNDLKTDITVAPIDSQTKAQLLGAVQSFQSAFVVPGSQVPCWGNTWYMTEDINGGITLKSLTDPLNTMNQGTSGIGTVVQTELQYATNDYDQILGLTNNAYKTNMQCITNEVQNSKASL